MSGVKSLLILLTIDELAVWRGSATKVDLALDELVGVGCDDLAAYRERGIEKESGLDLERAPLFPSLARTTHSIYGTRVAGVCPRPPVPGFLRARWTRAVAVGRQLFAFVHTFVSTS